MPADLSLDQESSVAINSTAVGSTTTADVPVVRRGTVRPGVRGQGSGRGSGASSVKGGYACPDP